jgi:hypothetical protein
VILEAIGHKSGVTMIGFDGEKMDRNVLLKAMGMSTAHISHPL